MKYSVKYKKVYDKNNNIIDISSVNNENREPKYYSIGSHTPMVAALGGKNKHHFRAKKGYVLNPETELHKYVKNILKYRFDHEEKFLIRYYRKETCPFKEKCIFFDNGKCEKLMAKPFDFDLKKYYDTATVEREHNGFVADVLLSSSSTINRIPVFLEVAVTHPCSEEKIKSGNKIIEIKVCNEDDAYCKLEQTQEYSFKDDVPIVKFYNFEDEIQLRECPHYSGEKKYLKQTPVVIGQQIRTKYYCIPQNFANDPIKMYFENVQIGYLFASNYIAKPFVFDKAMSLDKKSFVVMAKDIYGAIKPWVVYSINWNGRNYFHKVFAHFDYLSALKDFTILKGKEWTGGDVIDDYC